MRGERLEKATIIAKRRLKLKMIKWWNRKLDKPNEGEWAWGAQGICRFDISRSWGWWRLGSMDCCWGPNEAVLGPLRRHQTLRSYKRSKKNQPRMRGPRWEYDTSRYVRRRMEREVCLGFVTGRIETDGEWFIDYKQ